MSDDNSWGNFGTDGKSPWEGDFEDESWNDNVSNEDSETIDIEPEYAYDEEVICEDVTESQARNRRIAKKTIFFAIGMFLSGIASALFEDALNLGKKD